MPIAAHNRFPLALALVALLALAGCGSSSSGGGSTAQPATEPSATTSTAPSGEEGPVGARAQSCPDGSVVAPGLRVTGASCAKGRATVAAWQGESSCSSPAGASRFACTVAGLRCLGVATDRGVVVSCAGPGRSVSFVTRRG
jgi:hypothetical protein